jgi:hypothetical protein
MAGRLVRCPLTFTGLTGGVVDPRHKVWSSDSPPVVGRASAGQPTLVPPVVGGGGHAGPGLDLGGVGRLDGA